MRREELDYRGWDRDGARRPAVSARTDDGLLWHIGEMTDEPLHPMFDDDWIERHMTPERLGYLWHDVVDWELEYLETWAQEIFDDPNLKLGYEFDGYGHAWVWAEALGNPEYWDAVSLAKWAKFTRAARDVIAGLEVQMIHTIEMNEFEGWLEEVDDKLNRAFAQWATMAA